MSASTAQAPAVPAVTLSEKQQATYDLITRNLQEVLGEDIVKSKLAKDEVVSCYWGEFGTVSHAVSKSEAVDLSLLPFVLQVLRRPVDVSSPQCTTAMSWSLLTNMDGSPAHVGYFVPLTKIADFLKAGVKVRGPPS